MSARPAPSKAAGIDWHDVMALCLGTLRMRPADFWTLTPKELDAMLRGVFGPSSLPRTIDRPALAALMQRYPDTKERP